MLNARVEVSWVSCLQKLPATPSSNQERWSKEATAKAVWQGWGLQGFWEDGERWGHLCEPGVSTRPNSLQAGPWSSAVGLLRGPWPALALLGGPKLFIFDSQLPPVVQPE